MSSLTWLHISDWHHGDFTIDPEVVRDKLVEDIKGRLSISSDLAKIDFIVFSGDAAFNGKAKEYEDAKKEFFVPVLEAAQVEPNRLLIVPGNHDLDEEELEKLPDEFQKDAVSKVDVDRWLKDDGKREQLLQPFKDFRTFVSSFTGQDSPDYPDVQTWEINGKTVSLLGINSAWFCRRHLDASGKQNDYGFARVGERQVQRHWEKIRKSDLSIAVLHHSKDWLEYSDGQVVWRRLRQEYNFILHGHGHVPKVTAEHGTGGDCVIIPAGASFERRAAKDPSQINSYNFVHLDFETGKGFVFLRRWINERSVWDKDIQTYPEGKFSFDLPGYSPIPHQIRQPSEDFVGRSDEIEKLLAGFHAGATIAGLRGLGGEGKTALALVLAKELAGSYPDGHLFLNMQGTSSSPLKPEDAMAHVIRSYKGADCPLPKDLNGLSGLYQTVLSGKKALVLLDNAASREQVEPLLPPPGSALLVTSRIKFALPGLLEEMDLDPGVLPQKDAKRLLLKICERIGDHAEELANLCGCLPIALRNAAYALKEKSHLAPEGYIERLGDAKKRLELVEASFITSYDLLTPNLQRLWSLLSVFPADFDLAGVAAVWEMERIPAEDALGELMKWSLVYYLPSATGEAGRYRLHDLAHDFSNSRLTAVESENALERHSKHYRDLLWESEHLYQKRGHFVAEGLELFDKDWNNIQAGQKWAMINTEKSFEIAQVCSDYAGAGGILLLGLQSHPHLYIEWLKAALLAARKMDNKTAEGTHLGNLGLTYAALGDARLAIKCQEHAIKIFRKIGDRQRAAKHMGNLGLSYSHLGEFRKALEYHKKGLAVAREYGDRLSEGICLGNIGLAYYDLGNSRKAIEYHSKALAIARENKNISGEGNNLGNLGLAYHDLGYVRKAITYYEQTLKISQSILDSRSEEEDLSNLGMAYLDLGDSKRAMECFKRALVISRKIGDRRFEGAHLGNIGLVYLFLGDIKKAIKFNELTLEISRETGDRSQEGEALRVLGKAFADLKDTFKAIDYYEKSLEVVRKIEDRRSEGETLCGLGKVYVDIDLIHKGKEHLKQSLDIFRNIKFVRGEGEALFNISLAQEKLGQREEAVDLAKSALAIFEKIESPHVEIVRKKLAEWGA